MAELAHDGRIRVRRSPVKPDRFSSTLSTSWGGGRLSWSLRSGSPWDSWRLWSFLGLVESAHLNQPCCGLVVVDGPVFDRGVHSNARLAASMVEQDGGHDERVSAKANQLQSLDIYGHGAYSAPIVPETREHTAAHVGTHREKYPMGTRLSRMAGYG
jgi:hypothetical protein